MHKPKNTTYKTKFHQYRRPSAPTKSWSSRQLATIIISVFTVTAPWSPLPSVCNPIQNIPLAAVQLTMYLLIDGRHTVKHTYFITTKSSNTRYLLKHTMIDINRGLSPLGFKAKHSQAMYRRTHEAYPHVIRFLCGGHRVVLQPYSGSRPGLGWPEFFQSP